MSGPPSPDGVSGLGDRQTGGGDEGGAAVLRDGFVLELLAGLGRVEHALGGDESDVVDLFAGPPEEVDVAGPGLVEWDVLQRGGLIVGVAWDAEAEDAADRVDEVGAVEAVRRPRARLARHLESPPACSRWRAQQTPAPCRTTARPAPWRRSQARQRAARS